MKTILVSCELLALVFGIRALGFISVTQQDRLVKLANIFYINPVSRSGRPVIKLNDLQTLRNNQSIKFVIHGYFASMNHIAVAPLRNAYLSKGYDTLLMADWRDASSLLYPTTRYLIQRVGVHLAKILENFMRRQRISPTSVHVLGHSLGAHMAGVVGRYFNGTLGRVTGLDPAKPLFKGYCGDCLSSDVAQFVDVVHTDFPTFGDITPRGHADFYPNDGYAPQPGCDLLDIITATSCSHYRAPILFAESVRVPNNFPSVRCSIRNFSQLNGRTCLLQRNAEVILMGENVPRTARGEFYLETSYVPPYGFGAFSKLYVEYNSLS